MTHARHTTQALEREVLFLQRQKKVYTTLLSKRQSEIYLKEDLGCLGFDLNFLVRFFPVCL